MSLSELTAAQLARIDAICLAFERRLRAGTEPADDIELLVAQAADLPAELLRDELVAIQRELVAIQRELNGPSSAGDAPGDASRWGEHDPAPQQAVASMKERTSVSSPSRQRREDENRLADSGGENDSESESVFRVGMQLGPYRVESLIGRGGMGRVYRGHDARLHRPVAIKVLADDWARHPERIERFERESRAIAALRHSNIVSLYDVGTHSGRPYAVMELLEGETLRRRLDRGGLSVARICEIGVQIANALAAAHAGGIVHRDLKPENLILLDGTSHSSSGSGSESATVKLLDFGLSRAAAGEADGADDQTASGVVMGTAGYMAPEQARGLKATPAADIFSLGCVLYECFYGRKAFGGNSLAESLAAVLHQSPPADPKRAAEAPALAQLIAACLAKEVSERPDTAAVVAGRLAEMDFTAAEQETKAPWPAEASDRAMPVSASEPPSGRTAAVRFDRRRWLELVGGGAAGVASAVILPRWVAASIPPIDAIAVLPFYNLGGPSGEPIGGRELIEEERVAAMLVNELAKLPDLTVRPFRPMTVTQSRRLPTQEEFRSFAKQLEVGGLVLVEVAGAGSEREVNLQLVNAETGDVLWGKRFAYSGEPASLLQRTDTASILAEKIGQQLASIKATGQTKDEVAFFCLVRGKARFDPDSEEGMRAAINCFEHAAELDPGFIDAQAGLALTSMALAARTETAESQQWVSQAREAIAQAMQVSSLGGSRSEDPLVNLAMAIMMWQSDHRFEQAEFYFQAALHGLPNYWQSHHEYALYQAAFSRPAAVDLASRAAMLNPMAVSVRLDEARLRWFQGDDESAQRRSASIRRKHPNHRFATGLAVDVHEQRSEWEEAAQLLGITAVGSGDRRRYLAKREGLLEAVPYGPFGPTMNRAIWEARAGKMDEVRLQQIVDEQPPMLPLLLAAHPALAVPRTWAPAKSVVPNFVGSGSSASYSERRRGGASASFASSSDERRRPS